MESNSQFLELVEGVRRHLDELVPGVIRCFRNEIPAYGPIPDSDLVPGVRSNVERALQALERGWQPAPTEIAASRALGEERAHQGVPLDALLRAHRIGVREVLGWIQERANAHGIPAEVVLDTATRAWAWTDAVMLSAASGHRDVEVSLAGQERQQRAHVVRGLLAGSWSELDRSGTAAAYGVAAGERYVLVQARGSADELRRFDTSLARIATDTPVLSAEIDRDLVAVIPAARSDFQVTADLTVALSEPTPPSGLAEAHQVVVLVLDAAMALGRRGRVHLADVALHAGVLARPEIGRLFADRYIAPLRQAGEFGRQLLVTLPVWLDNGCRVEETALALYVHPNTLRHRIRRAEELLGVDLQDTRARFEIWWALAALGFAGETPPPTEPNAG